MATLNVTYMSSALLSCRCEEDAEIIICLDSSLTETGAPFIYGTLVSYISSADACGNAIYSYYLTYTDTDLADPTTPLISSQIEGVLCKGCLTDYIDYWTGGGGLPSFYFITTEQELIDFQTAPGSQGVVIASFALTQNVSSVKPLFIVENNTITCTGHVLSIYGPFSTGTYQCFDAVAGEVLFQRGSVDTIYTEWFGAVGDGLTDCYAAIQAALASAVGISTVAEYSGRFGNEVKLLTGRYLTTATIEVPTAVWLTGTTQTGSVIQASGLASGQAVVKFQSSASGQTHSTIKRLTVSGNGIAGVVGIDFFEWTAGSTQNNFSQVLECSIIRCTIGIKLDSRAAGKYTIFDKIEGCSFDQPNASFKHISISRGANYITIKNNHFFGTNGYALYVDNTFFGNYIEFTGNSVDVTNTVDWSSISINTVAGVQGISALITNNRLEGAGINVLNRYTSVQIVNNEIVDSPRGMFLDCKYSVVDGNWIYLKEANTTSGCEYGIELGTNSSYNNIGVNYYGIFGETSFCPTKVINNGIPGSNNITPHEFHVGTTQNGTFEVGDVLNNQGAVIGTAQQWICTVAGTIRGGIGPTTGDVNALDLYRVINVAAPVGYSRGSYITIAGCTGVYKIKGAFGNVLLLTTPASNAVAGAAIALQAPSFKTTTYLLKKDITANRPAAPTNYDIGMMYMDTTLDADGLPIWWNGSKWIKADGSDA